MTGHLRKLYDNKNNYKNKIKQKCKVCLIRVLNNLTKMSAGKRHTDRTYRFEHFQYLARVLHVLAALTLHANDP